MNTGFSAQNRHDGLWEVSKHVEPVRIFHTSWRTIVVWTAKNAARGSGLKRWPYASPLNVLAIDWKKTAPRDSQLLVRCLLITPARHGSTKFGILPPYLWTRVSKNWWANLQGNLFLNGNPHCFLYVFLEHIETWPPHVPDSFLGGNLRSDPRKPGILPKFAEYFFRVSDQDHKKKPHGKAEGEDG
jgi:hypothetical protein